MFAGSRSPNSTGGTRLYQAVRPADSRCSKGELPSIQVGTFSVGALALMPYRYRRCFSGISETGLTRRSQRQREGHGVPLRELGVAFVTFVFALLRISHNRLVKCRSPSSPEIWPEKSGTAKYSRSELRRDNVANCHSRARPQRGHFPFWAGSSRLTKTAAGLSPSSSRL